MEQEFISNIQNILDEKQIENIPLTRVDLLKDVLNDKELFEMFYSNFSKYFNENFSIEDLLMKTEDFLYRLHYVIDKWLIPIHHKETKNEIIEFFKNLKNIDLYSGVSYDDSDKEILEELEETFHGKEYKI